MSTEAALLAAIWDRPHDDVPRLVYADWLEENGDPARAEFIRVQCELAGLDEEDPRRPVLEKREQALWRKHGPGWKAGLPAALRTAGFVRGFPAPRVRRIPSRQFVRLPAEEFAAAPLWAVTMPPAPATLDKLLACPHLLRVGALDFREWLGGADAARRFAESPHVRNLAELDLGWSHALGGPGLAALAAGAAGLPHLRRLKLEACWLADRGVAALADSPLADTLTTLDLSENYTLTAGAVKAIFGPDRFARLTDLDVRFPTSPAGLKVIAGSAPAFRLRRLRVYIDRAANLTAFAEWPGLASVRELDVSNSPVGGRYGKLFRSPHLAGLRVLRADLSSTLTADAAVFDLLADGALPGLRELHLQFGGGIVPAGTADRLRRRLGTGLKLT